jgi:uncharacterized membrane protein
MRSPSTPRRVERQVVGAGRAIHPVLTPLALGLLGLGSALDAVSASAGSGQLTWIAFYVLVAGVALGSWCAVFALLDWICFAELGESGAWGIDGLPTAVVVGLYGGAVLLRAGAACHGAGASAMALEVVGAALLVNRSWIGRELAATLARR